MTVSTEVSSTSFSKISCASQSITLYPQYPHYPMTMLKKLTFLVISLALVASPVAVSAQSVQTVAARPAYCPTFDRSLRFGSRGSDVSSLQQFLLQQGFFHASATGYFGVATQAALQKWQAQEGVVASGSVQTTGWGVFGARSRAHLNQLCSGNLGNGGGNGGGSGGASQSFSADPMNGAAPLSVTFTTGDSIASSANYSVDFGDGQSDVMTKGSCVGITAVIGGQGGIRCSYSVSHTYAQNGTYAAHLMKNTCPSGTVCIAGPQTVGTVTITVGSSSTQGNIQRINAPASVTLSQGGIAEVRNESVYFTLTGMTATTATIQPTPVGCWNSFPSDPPPQIRCMIAIMPVAPITLSLGQTYTASNYSVRLSSLTQASATFSIGSGSGY